MGSTCLDTLAEAHGREYGLMSVVAVAKELHIVKSVLLPLALLYEKIQKACMKTGSKMRPPEPT